MLLAQPSTAVQGTGSASVAEDTGVIEATRDLEDAQRTYDDTLDRLDELASGYEEALAHAERLEGELSGAETQVEEAEAAVRTAQARRADQIRQAYKQPGVDLLRTSGAFLLASDVGSALHASAVMTTVAAETAAQAVSLHAAAERVVDNVSSQQGIQAGTASAMQDLRNLTVVFDDALEEAAAAVSSAEEALAEAEEDAEQQQLVSTGYQASFGYVPPGILREVTLPGGTQVMTCPLGQPNGFIDSWGFPRSGGRRHQGADMFAAYGMPQFAVADGYIRRVFHNSLGGLSIDLVDNLGNRYYYAHLSAAYVTDYQTVTVGQLIGATGQSGNAAGTPPHLHWQFHPGDGGPINPFPLAAVLCR